MVVTDKLKKSGFITVTSGMSGYFAVQMWWNPELGGFWEPYQSGVGRYSKRETAEKEAMFWAQEENIPYLKDGY